jgi:hypothetical protein
MTSRLKALSSVRLALIAGLVGALVGGGSSVAADIITGADVKNRSLTGRDLATGTLTDTHIRNGGVLSQDIRDGHVLSRDIEDGGVQSADLSADVQAQLAERARDGAKGEKGDPGAQGPPGLTGPQGAPGQDAAIEPVEFTPVPVLAEWTVLDPVGYYLTADGIVHLTGRVECNAVCFDSITTTPAPAQIWRGLAWQDADGAGGTPGEPAAATVTASAVNVSGPKSIGTRVSLDGITYVAD